MANKIGALTFGIVAIPPVSLSGNSLRLEGYFSEREDLLQLQEMFRKAEGGTVTYTTIGGTVMGYDLTEGSVLTQYCEFDIEHLRDGYYLLRSLDCNFRQLPEYFPFSIELLFLGSTALLQESLQIYQLEELTNDWE